MATDTDIADWKAAGAASSRRRERRDILAAASDLAGDRTSDRVLVIANAIGEWINQATGDDDRAFRFAAMRQAHTNYLFDNRRYTVHDRAAQFVSEASALYGFLAA